jgi:phospholipid transport system substrate-binding protein
MKQIVNGFLDYGELAHKSLAQHWSEISEKQRTVFVSTLKDLIEKNYVKQLTNNLDYQVVYRDQKVNGDEAQVETNVKVRTKGKSTDTEIDYKLHRVGGRWMVYDLITDEVSMVTNYKSQFHKIITRDGFDELLKKMQKKIAETDETAPDGKGGKPDKLDGKDGKTDASNAKAKGEARR